jgi:hypothetical protein
MGVVGSSKWLNGTGFSVDWFQWDDAGVLLRKSSTGCGDRILILPTANRMEIQGTVKATKFLGFYYVGEVKYDMSIWLCDVNTKGVLKLYYVDESGNSGIFWNVCGNADVMRSYLAEKSFGYCRISNKR